MLVLVPAVKEPLDGVHQAADAAKDTSLNRLAVEDRKPCLHLVHPTRAGGGEMELEARVVGQPLLHDGVLVGAVVIEHEVNLDVGVALGDHLENARNSWWRCRAYTRPVTVPVATSKAANRVAVPWRT